MSSVKKNEILDFPNVPDCVHQAVLDTLKEIGSTSTSISASTNEKERLFRMEGRRHYKKRVILLAAVIMTAVLATTAFATEFFSWNKRAKELFGGTKELQDKLVEEEIAKDESLSITDHGLTIRAVQTIQDRNCFYALFEVESEDPSILLDNNSEMDVLFDWEGEENPFIAIERGFVEGEEEGTTRMYEIFGTKANTISEKDLQMNLQFSALRQGGEKAMLGDIVLEGNWNFSLRIHQTEGTLYSIEKEFPIAGYQVLVHKVELSPVSITIVCDGADIKEMEQGEGISLDQLDTLYPMLLKGVKYQNGSVIDESGSQDLVEGFLANGDYYKTIRFSNVVEVKEVATLLLGEQRDEIELYEMQ